MSDLIGQNINQYRLDQVLGEGGMGKVFLAWDVNLDRQVAIKLMHTPLAVQKEFRQRLTQEAKTAASLEHPSIVRVYDFGDSEHGLFIAMEYIGGGTLRDLIRAVRTKNRFIQIDQIIQIGVHIAESLDYAHNYGVVHRDVKPGNIILKRLPQPEKPSGAPFRAMLSDFGLVKVSESTLKTQTGFTMGTPIYMSPEQCHGADLDGRSDIYSLGVVLYELVTGQPPFSFRSLTEALSTHMKAQMPPTPSTKRSEIPPVLDTVLMRMLAKDPSDRYQHGREVADVLRSASGALENTPTRAIPKISRDIIDQIDREISAPPEGFSLLLQSGDNEPSKVELSQAVITIGRSGNNDITLPLDGVSRFNTRLQATSAGWELTDLGGINGTFLNGQRVQSQVGVLLKSGDIFEIESYKFTVEGPESEDDEADSKSPEAIVSALLRDSDSAPPFDPDLAAEPKTPAQPSPAGLEAEQAREKLTLMLPRDKYRIKAGHSATVALEVFNRSQEMARVNVRVMGLPSEWVTPPEEFIEIPARSSKSVPVKIHIPRTPETPVGYQRMRVRLFSPQHPNLDSAASLMLELIGYSEFKAGMEPDTITLPEDVFITVKNTGNMAGRYAIKLGPYDGKLQIGKVMEPILLAPGETDTISIPLETSKIRIFGNRIEDRYNIHVTDIDDESQNRVMGGTVTYKPVFPMATAWLLGLFTLAGLLAACLLFTFRATSPVRDAFVRFTGGPTSTPQFTFLRPTSEIDQDSIRLTSEAEAATQAAGNPGLPETATPSLGLADTDADGLSNNQENVVGTNPTDPDSDKDGLQDGLEVLTLGTNPLIQDSDKDGLLDGEEVSNYRTNPLASDTDGDGISDRDEVLAQTDPLTAATLTPTVGPTQPPTETPTLTVTPSGVVPDATDTPIPTPTETATTAPADTPVVACNPAAVGAGDLGCLRSDADTVQIFRAEQSISVAANFPRFLIVNDVIDVTNGRGTLGFLGGNLRIEKGSRLTIQDASGLAAVTQMLLDRGSFSGEFIGQEVIYNLPNNANVRITGTSYFIDVNSDNNQDGQVNDADGGQRRSIVGNLSGNVVVNGQQLPENRIFLINNSGQIEPSTPLPIDPNLNLAGINDLIDGPFLIGLNNGSVVSNPFNQNGVVGNLPAGLVAEITGRFANTDIGIWWQINCNSAENLVAGTAQCWIQDTAQGVQQVFPINTDQGVPNLVIEAPAPTPTPTPTEATSGQPTTSLACLDLFVPDGSIGSEWTNSFIGAATSKPSGNQTLDVLMHTDGQHIYAGFRLSTPAVPASSQMTLLFEDGSGGDPDANDLKINVFRDGTFLLEGGLGGNADDLGFVQITDQAILDSLEVVSNSEAEADWVVEIKLPISVAQAVNANPFKFAISGDFSGEFVRFPEGSDLNLPDTHQLIGTINCTI